MAIFLTVSSFSFAYDKPIVTDISANYTKGTKINIVWTTPKNLQFPVQSYLLYRSTKPICTYEDLESATLIATLTPEESGFTDSLSDYSDYFYAVIISTSETYRAVIPSMNATIKGVRLIAPKKNYEPNPKEKNVRTYENGKLRETPLPVLDMIETSEPETNLISKEARDKSRNLGRPLSKDMNPLSPYIFEEDLIEPEKGDEYFLFEILADSFVIKDYEKAIIDLKRLTGTNVSQNVINRAWFYIGESYFFSGNYEEAVKYFIKIQLEFPTLSKKWISESLDRI